ncbi:hypothetical protein TruAng_007145 [Truncatella angustata]|nr:hypothetical protein TruAng_007145 [Truncatella angustata]
MDQDAETQPQFTEARDFTRTPQGVTPAHSIASNHSGQQGRELVRPNTVTTGTIQFLPGPVLEPARRHTTIISTEDQSGDVRRTSRTFPTTVAGPSRPFFISPFLKTPETSSDVSPERNIQGPPLRVQMDQPEKRVTNDTQQSSVTEKEWEHQRRMEQKRRAREFPRRLITSIVGGVFVIAPMVTMSIDRSLTKDLITSCVAILLFGITLAWVSTSDEVSLFVATVGYAAFLAVFVAVGDDKNVAIMTRG